MEESLSNANNTSVPNEAVSADASVAEETKQPVEENVSKKRKTSHSEDIQILADSQPSNSTQFERHKETFADIEVFLSKHEFSIDQEDLEGKEHTIEAKQLAQERIDFLKGKNTFHSISPFDWAVIEKAYANIFNDYIDSVENIALEFEKLQKERKAWQEIVFTLDRERSAAKINRSERWISANEIYLNNIKSSLKNSVNLIKKEFSKYDSKAASDSSLLQQVDESSS